MNNLIIEQIVDFPWDEIESAEDRGNPLASELSEANLATSSETVTLGKVFSLLLTHGGTNATHFFIGANVLAFVLGIHPNQDASGETIAAGLKMKKAAWFRRVNQMRQYLSERKSILPKIAGQWSDEARRSIAKKTKKYHDNRKSNPKKRAGIDRIGAAYKKSGIGD